MDYESLKSFRLTLTGPCPDCTTGPDAHKFTDICEECEGTGRQSVYPTLEELAAMLAPVLIQSAPARIDYLEAAIVAVLPLGQGRHLQRVTEGWPTASIVTLEIFGGDGREARVNAGSLGAWRELIDALASLQGNPDAT